MLGPFIPFIQEFLTIIITWDVRARLTGRRRRGSVVLLDVNETTRTMGCR